MVCVISYRPVRRSLYGLMADTFPDVLHGWQRAASGPMKENQVSYPRSIGKPLLIPAAVVGVASAASAHDFWIQPSTYRPAPGGLVEVALRVGHPFEGQAVPRNPERIDRFMIVTASGETPIPGVDGRDPAGLLRVGEPGWAVIAYRSKRTFHEMAPDAFLAYCKEEGIDHCLANAPSRYPNSAAAPPSAVGGDTSKPGSESGQAKGQSGTVEASNAAAGVEKRPVREYYSRCAKSILAVGQTSVSGYDRAVGFPLELVLKTDPSKLRVGDEMVVELLYQGRPLEGANIHSASSSGQENPKARTDAQGRAAIRCTQAGPWFLGAVHLFPAEPAAEADWESLWASVTFEVSRD